MDSKIVFRTCLGCANLVAVPIRRGAPGAEPVLPRMVPCERRFPQSPAKTSTTQQSSGQNKRSINGKHKAGGQANHDKTRRKSKSACGTSAARPIVAMSGTDGVKS
jgi:hypothetical protein